MEIQAVSQTQLTEFWSVADPPPTTGLTISADNIEVKDARELHRDRKPDTIETDYAILEHEEEVVLVEQRDLGEEETLSSTMMQVPHLISGGENKRQS